MIRAVSCLGLLAFLASPALAQRGGGFGMGAGPNLLSNKSVQQELKVDKDQAQKLDALASELGQKMRSAFQDLQNVPQEERREKGMELNRSIQAEMKKSLPDILKPDQMKRFAQIRLQVSGADAFSDSEVQSKLKLSDEQKEKIKSIVDESRGQMREIFQSAGDDRQAAMQKMTELRKETAGKATNVLSSEQKSTWKEMAGEPFDYKPEPPRRPGA